MDMCSFILVAILVLSPVAYGQTQEEIDRVVDHIRQYQGDVKRMIEYMKDEGRHQPYNRIQQLTDEHGHRVSGSEALEDAIDDMRQQMSDEGFIVTKENVTVPDLRRGIETARLVRPLPVDMDILGLGFTVATNGTLTAEAIVVKSFDELNEEATAGNTDGKIVVFNQKWEGYPDTVAYRTNGAVAAANAGARAVLIKSVADYSLYTPHTGTQNYNDSVPKIPTACLTIEDAEMLQRYQDNNQTIEIELYIDDYYHGDTISYNLVAEIKGEEKPDEYVIFGGHIDSWDVGTGVMDDGGGVVISWQVLTLIKELDLKPKRTLRFVAWTAEEVGIYGGWAFYEAHKHEIENVSLVMESDYGTFKPTGIRFTGSELATYYMQAVVDLTSELGTNRVLPDGSQADTGMWMDDGVPGAALGNENHRYFWYHHTKADTLTMQDPDDLDECAMLWAATVYVVANMDEMLPRDGALPPTEPPAGRGTMMATANCFLLIGVYIFHATVM